MKCEQVMTKDPVFCLAGDTVVKASQLMKTNDIGSVPVVESAESKKVIGMLTDRDIAIKVVSEARDLKTALVGDVMSKQVVACQMEDDVQKALDLMGHHQLRRIPVLNKDNVLVGIIAQADLATRLNEPEETANTIKEISSSKALHSGMRKKGNQFVWVILIVLVIIAVVGLKYFHVI